MILVRKTPIFHAGGLSLETLTGIWREQNHFLSFLRHAAEYMIGGRFETEVDLDKYVFTHIVDDLLVRHIAIAESTERFADRIYPVMTLVYPRTASDTGALPYLNIHGINAVRRLYGKPGTRKVIPRAKHIFRKVREGILEYHPTAELTRFPRITSILENSWMCDSVIVPYEIEDRAHLMNVRLRDGIFDSEDHLDELLDKIVETPAIDLSHNLIFSEFTKKASISPKEIEEKICPEIRTDNEWIDLRETMQVKKNLAQIPSSGITEISGFMDLYEILISSGYDVIKIAFRFDGYAWNEVQDETVLSNLYQKIQTTEAKEISFLMKVEEFLLNSEFVEGVIQDTFDEINASAGIGELLDHSDEEASEVLRIELLVIDGELLITMRTNVFEFIYHADFAIVPLVSKSLVEQ